MNIIQDNQEKRAKGISQIQESIREIIREEKGLVKKDLVLGTMAELNLSKRTATDYLEVALFKEGIKI